MNAAEIIRESEGLRLKAYPDPGSGGIPWTIGYGHTKGVKKGDTCTIEQANAWLADDMAEAFAIVDKAVKVPLTDKQRDALCSFVFNVGGGAFQKSTMLKLLNQGKYSEAAAQFPRWTFASGKSMRGLVIRRGKERALFLSGTNIPQPAFPEENTVPPFLALAIPAFIQALPEFAKIFQKTDVAERNVEAAVKAADMIIQATNATNLQDAVEKVQADPELAQVANDSLRANRAEFMDMLERAWDRDDKSVADARIYADKEKPVVGNWHFVHVLTLLLVILGGAAAVGVLFTSANETERGMALQALLLVGFGGAVTFWLGSSRSSQLKDQRKD
jgi:lysozyme